MHPGVAGSAPGPQALPVEGLAPSSPAPAPTASPGILDAILRAAVVPDAPSSQVVPPAPGSAAEFLREASPWRALALWLGPSALHLKTRRALLQALDRDIARIDGILSKQVNAILHHPRFQGLEAAWRGIRYLVDQAEDAEDVKIKVLNASWKELAKDAERAVEFDQSQMFRKIYSEEFGTPGGEPFGVLLGDYGIRHRPGPDHPIDDLEVLASISQVAAAAFAPFIAGAAPELFGLESFSQLERPMQLARIFEQPEYIKWKAFRETEDSRFTGLTLPRILLRLPYGNDGSRDDGFLFKEDVEGPDRSKYLWGNAAFAFGAVLVRAYRQSGWLAEIRGVRRDEESNGLVTGLPVHSFGTDRQGIAPKSSTDLIVGDAQEKELGDLGLIPLCHCPDTEYCAFYGNQSLQKPKVYNELPATMNARISAMLQYMLCVSRFAHYLKIRMQSKIGSFAEAREVEDDLNRWIHDYVAPDAEASASVKAKYPLREAQIQVAERPGKPGNYMCVMHLLPHYQLDAVTATVTLRTEMGPMQGR